MRARFIGLIFALSSAAGGCSLVANFDGLVGNDTGDGAANGDDASVTDGNIILADGAQPPSDANNNAIDASTDAPILDTGTTPTDDGAPPQLQGTGGAFCTTDASTILFCDDFGGNKINTNVWDTNRQGMGALIVQSRSYWSSPRAFLGFLPAQASGDNYQAINANIPFGTGRFKVEFKFYLDFDLSNTQGGSGTNYGDFMQLYLDNDSAYGTIYFSKNTFSMEVDTFSGATENDLDFSLGSGAPPTGAWHAMEIDTVFSATATGSIVVMMDGTQIGSQSNIVNLIPDAGAPTFEPGFGIENIGAVGQTYLYIDDVRVSSF